MLAGELAANVLLMLGCYLYVFAVILVSGKLDKFLSISSDFTEVSAHNDR